VAGFTFGIPGRNKSESARFGEAMLFKPPYQIDVGNLFFFEFVSQKNTGALGPFGL
jgi:hypothetical protein